MSRSHLLRLNFHLGAVKSACYAFSYSPTPVVKPCSESIDTDDERPQLVQLLFERQLPPTSCILGTWA